MVLTGHRRVLIVKPTFLGEKFVSTYRANQEKVIGSQITANRISDGVIRTSSGRTTTATIG